MNLRNSVLATTVALLILGSAIMVVGAPPGKLPTVKISIDMWIGFGPLVLGKEKGLFEKRGILVEPVVITGTGEKNAAMVSKQVLGRVEGLDSIVLAGNQGTPGTVVLAVDESTGGDGIVAAANIRSVADLRGKTVGFQSGLPGHFFLLYLLHEAGLTEADISPQVMDSGAAGAAFVAGKLDAAATWEPWLSKASQRTGAHLLASTREHRGVIVDVLAMHPEFVRDHPDGVRKIMLGWFDAVEYWRKNPKESNSIMGRFFKVPVDELEAILLGVQFCDLKRNAELFGSPDTTGRVYEVGQKAGQIWFRAGVLRSRPKPVEGMIDATFIRKLAR